MAELRAASEAGPRHRPDRAAPGGQDHPRPGDRPAGLAGLLRPGGSPGAGAPGPADDGPGSAARPGGHRRDPAAARSFPNPARAGRSAPPPLALPHPGQCDARAAAAVLGDLGGATGNDRLDRLRPRRGRPEARSVGCGAGAASRPPTSPARSRPAMSGASSSSRPSSSGTCPSSESRSRRPRCCGSGRCWRTIMGACGTRPRPPARSGCRSPRLDAISTCFRGSSWSGSSSPGTRTSASARSKRRKSTCAIAVSCTRFSGSPGSEMSCRTPRPAPRGRASQSSRPSNADGRTRPTSGPPIPAPSWICCSSKSSRRYGVEVKFQDAPRVTPSMRIALADLQLHHLTVLYPGDQRYSLDPHITVVPLADLASDPGVITPTTRGRRP